MLLHLDGFQEPLPALDYHLDFVLPPNVLGKELAFGVQNLIHGYYTIRTAWPI